MTEVLPACFANRSECTWDIPGAFTSGGVNVFGGSPQVRRMDGGGAWRAQLRGLKLIDQDHQRTWSAFMAGWNGGETKIVVPLPWSRLRADFAGPLQTLPWSDGMPFDDGTLFNDGTGWATLSGAVALRAYQATMILPPGASLKGGEPFTLVGATYGARLHTVSRVTDVIADDAGDMVSIEFSPVTREAYDDEADVDFQTPRCTMRAIPDTEGAAPVYGRSRFAAANMTFWEDL